MTLATDIKALRQQIEKLQVEVGGRQHISSMVVWDQQNQSSVYGETSRIREDFSGLVIHLTKDASPVEGTKSASGLSQNEFNALKQKLLDEQSIQLGEVIS